MWCADEFFHEICYRVFVWESVNDTGHFSHFSTVVQKLNTPWRRFFRLVVWKTKWQTALSAQLSCDHRNIVTLHETVGWAQIVWVLWENDEKKWRVCTRHVSCLGWPAPHVELDLGTVAIPNDFSVSYLFEILECPLIFRYTFSVGALCQKSALVCKLHGIPSSEKAIRLQLLPAHFAALLSSSQCFIALCHWCTVGRSDPTDVWFETCGNPGVATALDWKQKLISNCILLKLLSLYRCRSLENSVRAKIRLMTIFPTTAQGSFFHRADRRTYFLNRFLGAVSPVASCVLDCTMTLAEYVPLL